MCWGLIFVQRRSKKIWPYSPGLLRDITIYSVYFLTETVPLSPFRLGTWFPSSCSPQRVCHQLHYHQHQWGIGPGREAAAGGNELHLPESHQHPNIRTTGGDRGHDRRDARAAPPRHSLWNVMKHADIPEKIKALSCWGGFTSFSKASSITWWDTCGEREQKHHMFAAGWTNSCKGRSADRNKWILISCLHLVLHVLIISSLLQFSVKWYLAPECEPLTVIVTIDIDSTQCFKLQSVSSVFRLNLCVIVYIWVKIKMQNTRMSTFVVHTFVKKFKITFEL